MPAEQSPIPVATVPPHLPRPDPPQRVDSLAVAELVRDGASEPAVEAFWRDAAATGTPLVEERPEDPGHVTVTFLWRGGGEAAAVLLVANKIADPASYEDGLLERVPGTDVWHLSYRMADDWRGSYALAPVPADDVAPAPGGPAAELLALRRARSLAAARPEDHAALERWYDAVAFARPDPLARQQLDGTWSIAALPRARPQPWLAVPEDVPPGTTTAHRIESAHLDGGRDVWVHRPGEDTPGSSPPRPLLVLLDGQEWVDLPVGPVLDHLVARSGLPALVTVAVSSGSFEERVRDLACSPAYLRFLTEELVPWVAERVATTTDPARTIIAGQSLGGLTALFAAHAAPEHFGCVVAQSGSFWWPNAAGGEGSEWLTAQLAASTAPPPVTYLEVGTQEWVLLEPTRRLRAVLEQHRAPLTYVEHNGGHDRACWRGGLAEGLLAVTEGW